MRTLDQESKMQPISLLAEEDMLRDCEERMQDFGERARKSLDNFTFEDGVIKGASVFGNVFLASKHLSLPSQISHSYHTNYRFFSKIDLILGLILKTNGDSYKDNDYNAKNLYEQVKRRGLDPSEENPVIISLRGLRLEEDNKSHYGLIHKLGDETQVFQAPELSYENDGKEYLHTDERGVPIFYEEELGFTFEMSKEGIPTFKKRLINTFDAEKDDGLSVLCMIPNCPSYRYVKRLDDSFASSGRVAVTKTI